MTKRAVTTAGQALHGDATRRAEFVVLVAFVTLTIAALLLPAIAQDPQYHRFADQRTWLGMPRAADVLSNAGFVVVGVFGFVRLTRAALKMATRVSLWFVAIGFLLTGFGSAWYHANPSDPSLVWDRLPMTIVLAGVIGAAIAERIGERASLYVLFALLVGGIATVIVWHATDNLTPYGVFQFGGILLLLAVLLMTPVRGDPFPWIWIVGWYAIAKIAELGDAFIWRATDGIVAGHAIKHVTAAAAGAAMFVGLRRR